MEKYYFVDARASYRPTDTDLTRAVKLMIVTDANGNVIRVEERL